MTPLRKIIFQQLRPFHSLKIYIIISLVACLFCFTWGQIATTQTPIVSSTSPVEETVESPNPSPTLSPYPKEKSPRPTLRKSPSSLVKKHPQVQELIQRLNITPEEAKKLLWNSS